MTNLRFLNRKILVPVVIIAVAASLIFWGLPQAISAAINQTMNSATSVGSQLPKFTGSVNVGQTLKNLNYNVKVSFPQAAAIAAKQITNGTVVGGHLGVVQGYLRAKERAERPCDVYRTRPFPASTIVRYSVLA